MRSHPQRSAIRNLGSQPGWRRVDGRDFGYSPTVHLSRMRFWLSRDRVLARWPESPTASLAWHRGVWPFSRRCPRSRRLSVGRHNLVTAMQAADRQSGYDGEPGGNVTRSEANRSERARRNSFSQSDGHYSGEARRLSAPLFGTRCWRQRVDIRRSIAMPDRYGELAVTAVGRLVLYFDWPDHGRGRHPSSTNRDLGSARLEILAGEG